MMRITPVGEPVDFDERVRTPGDLFLQTADLTKKSPYRGREYWRAIIPDLHAAYSSICAYTCHWIPLDVGNDTVEHFEPKSLYPQGAYEWNNFRLVCGRLNGRKGNHQDVVDPFTMPPNMFELKFPSLLIEPRASLPPSEMSLAKTTRSRLKLNEERCVRSRLKYVTELCEGEITLSYLKRHAPFIHAEINRQGILNQLSVIMSNPN